MLAQDHEDSPYSDDTYENSFAGKSSRKGYREAEPTDEEMDDDFVPDAVRQKVKRLQCSLFHSR